ncbi:MAG: bile acid:sodium symporter, partial [Fuerstiella sp.]|nr:bile acid:sodium symporter [Fuerstiella sp.]
PEIIWFLVGLVALIPLALFLASSRPPAWSINFARSVPTSLCTATILFLMSVTLNSRRLFDSLRKPWPVLTACGVNQIMIPLLCFPLLALQKSADLRAGLLIAASVPCTMAAASVWTRRAAGNDAVSLLVTLITNGLCFLITPLWLLAGSKWFGTADASGSLQFSSMVWRLVLAALLPAFVGQMIRLSKPVETIVDDNKPIFGNIAQCIILLLVFVSAFRGGVQFESTGMASNLRHQEFATVWVCCIVLHLTAMGVVWQITGLARFAEEDRRACVFAGSQKTLPIGILVSQATGLPFSILPMLMYHMSQLFIDTWIADRLKSRATQIDS